MNQPDKICETIGMLIILGLVIYYILFGSKRGTTTVIFKKSDIHKTNTDSNHTTHSIEQRTSYLSQLPQYNLHQYNYLIPNSMRWNKKQVWNLFNVSMNYIELYNRPSSFVFDVSITVKYLLKGPFVAFTNIKEITVYVECLPNCNTITNQSLLTAVIDND